MFFNFSFAPSFENSPQGSRADFHDEPARVLTHLDALGKCRTATGGKHRAFARSTTPRLQAFEALLFSRTTSRPHRLPAARRPSRTASRTPPPCHPCALFRRAPRTVSPTTLLKIVRGKPLEHKRLQIIKPRIKKSCLPSAAHRLRCEKFQPPGGINHQTTQDNDKDRSHRTPRRNPRRPPRR